MTSVAIGEHPDAAIIDADAGTVFKSNGGGTGTLTVIHEDNANHYSVQANVGTRTSAKTTAFEKVSKAVYVPTIVDDRFWVLVVTPK